MNNNKNRCTCKSSASTCSCKRSIQTSRKTCSCRNVQNCKCPSAFELFGVQAELTSAQNEFLENQEIIIFDKIINNNKQLISYQKETGKFCLRKAGNYLINWDCSVEGSYSEPFITLSLTANNQVIGSSTLPVTIGQLSGTKLLNVRRAPVEITLINNTGETIRLSEFTPVANLTITKILHTIKSC